MDTEPWRQNFWNIPYWAQIFLYLAMALAVLALLVGVYRRIQVWRAGQPTPGFDHLSQRLGRLARYAVAQVRLLGQRYPGVMHAAIFWAFLFLFAGTALATLDADVYSPLSLKLLKGDFYLIYKTVLDLAGLAFVAGLALAIYRRYVTRPDRLGPTRLMGGFAFTLGLLLAINLSGLLVESLRLAVVRPPWAGYSVVGYPLSLGLGALGLDEATLRGLHLGMWFLHFGAVAAFVATLPYSTLFHLVTAPLNVFTSSLKPAGQLAAIEDIETAERLGAGRLADFTWPQLLSLDACTECGRCQAACPAHLAGMPLNPKRLVVDLRDYMAGQADGLSKKSEPEEGGKEMVGDVIARNALWACTTCSACAGECPVLVNPMDAVVDMRRYLTLSWGDLPGPGALALQNLNRAGNPWGQPPTARDEWAKGLDVPRMADKREADVLWWVGCAGAYDQRNQRVSRALASLFKAAGVDYAILGQEETCTGDPARRLGDEALFQTLARRNIATLQKYRFGRIVTACPHCFNTLRNEYPTLGGRWEVVHHSQFLSELLAAGRLKLSRPLEATVTFHDSCYLGRANGVYDAPRRVLNALPGASLAEMPRSRESGLCCGGGGGGMWLEVHGERRIQELRLEEAAATKPAVVASACPFCLLMFDLGGKTLKFDDKGIQIEDIAELAAEAMVN
jgi:Fe-S oxidoreductase